MKNILTVLFFIHLSLSLFGQNPIIKEELFEERNGEWVKVTIIDRAFDDQGNLTYEETLYFDNRFQKWIPYIENRYDANGNNTESIFKSLLSEELGFYIDYTLRQFNEVGDLLVQESFVKENKDSEQVLTRRVTNEYLDNCTYLQRIYQKEGDAPLELSVLLLFVYDKNCVHAETIRSDDLSIDINSFRNQVRITFEPTSNGGQRRIVEKLTCPDELGCDTWEVQSRNTYDAEGRLIINESGSIQGSYRFIVSTDYEPTQKVITTDSYARTFGDSTGQQLVNRRIITYDLEDNVLSSIYIDPFSIREAVSEYNDKGFIHKTLLENRVKNSTGIQVFRDTFNFLYQYYCDDLLAEQLIDYGDNARSKMTFSYLYPADCGQVNTIVDFSLFPNPAKSLLNIENEAFSNGNYTFDIFDLTGRHIRSFSNYRSATQTVNLEDLPNGVYQLSIQNIDGRTTKPFIIQR